MELHQEEGSESGLFNGSCFIKLGQAGVFLDDQWDSVYMLVGPGYIRIYASETDYYENQQSYVFEQSLSPNHLLSEVISKNYSRDPSKPIIIHSFYIYKSIGFLQIKVIKIGSLSEQVVQTIRKTVGDFRYAGTSINSRYSQEYKTPLFR